MRIRKNKKVRISIILFILMFCMGIGYAALHTDIRGTGTALLKSRSFNVYYSNVQTIAGSVTPTTAPTTSGQSTTGLSWEVDLNTPGQFYEFTADVTNAGTVDAMIAEVLDTTLTTEQAQYLTYTVTYADYKPIEQYDKLAINETDSIRIRLEVKPDVQPADIPANTQIALNLGCIYGIADSNAEERTKAVTYTVTFDKNHADATGIMTAQEIIEDRATPLTANSFARTGYHFTSWNTAANGSGTSYTDGQSVTNIEDTTLYAQWAVNTYTIAFDANGGTGTMTGMSMTYGVAANLTSNDFTYSGYNFVKWNTEADGSGTDYTDEQSVNNLTTENGATVILYAQWEQAEIQVKYAVQIYGINQDVDANDQPLGLTFGPAVGEDFNDKYITHTYRDNNDGTYTLVQQIYTVGNNTPVESDLNVIRTSEKIQQYGKKIHDMSWTEIAAEQNKEVFTDSMLCGDTKCVNLTLNDTIASGTLQTATGDGAGIINRTINQKYLPWNPKIDLKTYGSNARNAGGYSISHIRATLIGQYANPTYAGNDNLTTDNCLYSCIESELQNVITAKKIKYVTGTSTSSYSVNTSIADKIWLFSEREMYSTSNNSGKTSEGLGSSGIGYYKFGNAESKYSMKSYNTSASLYRTCYNELSIKAGWWLRSLLLSSSRCVISISNSGSINTGSNANDFSGISFGFCIK